MFKQIITAIATALGFKKKPKTSTGSAPSFIKPKPDSGRSRYNRTGRVCFRKSNKKEHRRRRAMARKNRIRGI